MALFDESVQVVPAPPRRMPRGMLFGIWALVVALIALLTLTFLPTSFVIQRPGPVYNTLGEAKAADGSMVPLITVADAETYPTAGTLDLLTVQVVGNRERTPSWFELAVAWFDPSRAVLPIDAVFPQGTTTEERNAESAQMMVDSQKEATAAALRHLGHDVPSHLEVYSLPEGSASAGVLREGDVIVSAGGTPTASADALRKTINDLGGKPVPMVVTRDGREVSVSVTPKEGTLDGEKRWLIGVSLIADYDFPISVTIQLNNVGGPSAGMMFALGIIDTLTPGELTGGKDFAGTGTIDAEGTVGPIGGIRQKMFGAQAAGAEYFLAPTSNCDEVYGHVPSGLEVFAVSTLDEALTAVETAAEGGDVSALPTCTAADVAP